MEIVGCEVYEAGSPLALDNGQFTRELDYIAIVNMSTRSVSYRTIKDDVDMGMIAKKYGGGGHAKAAGSKFDVYKLAKFLDELLD